MTDYNDFTGTDLLEKLDMGDLSHMPSFIQDKLNFSHSCRELSKEERDEVILSIMSTLHQNKLRVSGDNDNSVWEKGWGEVLNHVKTCSEISLKSLVPQYFKKDPVYRLFGEYIYTDSDYFIYDIDQIIRSLVFSKYFMNYKRIVEIGSGTGISQYILAQLCPPDVELIGSDWATKSQEILQLISSQLNRPITPVNFNMLTLEGFDNLTIDNETAVFSVHTLEQLGTSYKPLLEKLIESNPALCLHMEPMKEFYDENNLMDYLALSYHDARNYLNGWLTELRELESKGKVQIIEQRKIPIGNKYHEAYNLVVWKPC